MNAPDKIFARVVAGTLTSSPTQIEIFGEKYPAYIRADLLAEFADIVRRYVAPTRDDKFCSRSELMQALAKFNEIIQ